MDLRKRIREQGFTQETLAPLMKGKNGKMGVPQSSISQLINNGNPTYQKLKEIADIIGLTVSELVRDDDEEPKTAANMICPHCGKPIGVHFEAIATEGQNTTL